jgi:hypothetical protein
MSNYSAPTRHPVTGAIEMADWLDDSFGRHIYGVRFHGEEKIYPGKNCAEISPDEMLEEIERLRAALLEISKLTPDSYLSFDSFAIDYARMTALAALKEDKAND